MAKFAALLPFVYFAVASAQSTSVSWNNVTGTSSTTFPTDVGFLGPVAYAPHPPFLAQDDKLNSTQPFGNYGIEMRWLPKDADKSNATSADIFRNLGTTSPYHPADDLFPETHGYEVLPEQCTVKQVHILHRHGARNPTSSTHEGAPLFGATLWNATKAGKFNASGELEFLNHWNYTLGAETLVHQGAQELFDSGVKFYYQYGKLLENLTEHKPVIRTTSQSRMLDTARYWALGFFGWDAAEKVNLEVLTEWSGQNITLAPYDGCNNTNVDSFALGDIASSQWQKVYLKNAIERLQKLVHGIKLDETLMYGMMSICAYESVAMGYSKFCPLFTKEEFENYEYDIDLQFQGDYGFMNPSGKAQGIGYVTEFLSRLNNTKFTGPVTDQNSTLDKNTTYFPVDQPLYADFTHDDVIHSVLTSLNFTQIADFLPTTKPDPKRRYRSSRVTPFAARLVFEVLECKENNASTKYIRSKINEAVIPMDQDQGCEKRPDGLCKFDDFLQHQQKNAYKDAKYDLVCFGKNGTDFTVTGPVRNGTI